MGYWTQSGSSFSYLSNGKARMGEARGVTRSYIFGSPRVRDRTFSRAFNKDLKDRTFRFVNNNDIVSKVPPCTLGYRHVGSLRYLLDVNGDIYEEINWFSRLIDRIKGKLEELGNPGIDGVKDHNIARYVKILGNLKKRGYSVDFCESLDVV